MVSYTYTDRRSSVCTPPVTLSGTRSAKREIDSEHPESRNMPAYRLLAPPFSASAASGLKIRARKPPVWPRSSVL